MIEYIRGQLVSAGPGNAVIEIGGIAIAVQMPPADYNLSSKVGQEITIFTRLLVKEDEMLLFGFRAAEERKLFNLIISVSGFGPRLALSLLAIFSVSQLYLAVLEENIPLLCRAHGVGKKAAQRLVLELKEKLPKVMSGYEVAAIPAGSSSGSVYDDLVEALCSLGYSGSEAAVAVGKVVEEKGDRSREELLKLALKRLAQG